MPMRSDVRRDGNPRPLAFFGAKAGVAGSSLIETLVAINIIVVGLSILTQVVVRGIGHTQVAQSRAKAAFLAQTQMEDILAARRRLAEWEETARETLPEAEVQGAVRFADPDLQDYCWSWNIRTSPDHSGMKEVRVQVWHKARAEGTWKAIPPMRTLVFVGGEDDDPAVILARVGDTP